MVYAKECTSRSYFGALFSSLKSKCEVFVGVIQTALAVLQ